MRARESGPEILYLELENERRTGVFEYSQEVRADAQPQIHRVRFDDLEPHADVQQRSSRRLQRDRGDENPETVQAAHAGIDSTAKLESESALVAFNRDHDRG